MTEHEQPDPTEALTAATTRKPRPVIRWIIWLVLSGGFFFATLSTRDDPALFSWGANGLLPILCLLIMTLFTAITLNRSILVSMALIGLVGWAGLTLDPEFLKPIDHMFVWSFFAAGLLSLILRVIIWAGRIETPRYWINLPHPLDKIINDVDLR